MGARRLCTSVTLDDAMKDDDRDTQKMMPLRPEDVEPPVVHKFVYRTDPGTSNDADHELMRGVSRARDNRDDRSGTIGKVLDDIPESKPSRAPTSAPARPVRIVHKWSLPTWLTIVAITLAMAMLALAVVIASKSKKETAAAATPAAVVSAPIASKTEPSSTPAPTASAAPMIPTTVTATAVRTAASAPTRTSAPPSATAAATHPDNDIIRTPEL